MTIHNCLHILAEWHKVIEKNKYGLLLDKKKKINSTNRQEDLQKVNKLVHESQKNTRNSQIGRKKKKLQKDSIWVMKKKPELKAF